MTAVTIPAELAADVAARPEAYRPGVEVGGRVLVLDRTASELGVGWTGEVNYVNTEPESVAYYGGTMLHVEHPAGDAEATAWALVGSIDGGPRPAVGDRVLVLECAPGACTAGDHAGRIARVASGDATKLPDVDVLDHRGRWESACLPSRWAILPPAAADDLPSTATAKPDTAGLRPDPDRLPPGALPAAQLHDPRAVGPGAYAADVARTGAAQLRTGPRCTCGRTDCQRVQPPATIKPSMAAAAMRAETAPLGSDEDQLRADLRAARQRDDALDMLDAGEVPPGAWRVGGHAPRNLYIGPPRPYGVDVGRMDTPELAAYVVAAVNERERLRAALQRIADAVPPSGLTGMASRGLGQPAEVPNVGHIARDALDGTP